MNDKPKNRFFQRKYINIALTLFLGFSLSILFFFALYYKKNVHLSIGKIIDSIKPFIYGGVLAYLLVPACNSLQRLFERLFSHVKKLKEKTVKKIANFLSIACSLILAVLTIYLLLSLIIPELVHSISVIISNFDDYYNAIMEWVNNQFNNNSLIHDYIEGITENLSTTMQNWLKTDLLPNATILITNVSSGILGAFSIVKNLFISLIVAMYFLNSRKTFAAQAKILVHSIFKGKIADKIISEVQFANKMFMGFISGRLLDSAIIGVLCFIGLSILKIPYPLLISVVVGITNIIPFFGPFIGGIPSAFLILMIDPIKCLWFIIFIVVLQQIDGNLIGPKIVGEMTNLNSFWVLFAILLFSGLFGFPGMLIGVPVFAVIYHLVQELIMKGLTRTGYVPDEEEAETSLLNKYKKNNENK